MKRLLPLLLPALCGCALLGKSDPQVPRYFTPEFDADAPGPLRHPELQVRLGRVEGASHLRERMVARNAARELFFSEDRRWTERPEVYLRRALARALFEERGLVEGLSESGLALDVELLEFEEVLGEPHLARLQALVVLRDERVGLLEETVTADAPVARGARDDQGRAVADALSQALREGVSRIADRVVARLAERKPAGR